MMAAIDAHPTKQSIIMLASTVTKYHNMALIFQNLPLMPLCDQLPS